MIFEDCGDNSKRYGRVDNNRYEGQQRGNAAFDQGCGNEIELTGEADDDNVF